MADAPATTAPAEEWLREVYVHLPHGLDADAYRRRYEAGEEPDESPYGFHVARERCLTVQFSKDETRLLRRGGWRIQRLFRGLDLLHALYNRRRLAKADVVWTMLEEEALALALLMRLRILERKPIIAGCVWMINEWQDLSERRQRLIRSLASFVTVLTVHSEPCLPLARRDLPGVKSRLLRFGIAASSFPPVTTEATRRDGPLRIVAVGNNRLRDWDVLLRAFGNDPRFHLTIVCWWLEDAAVAAYDNVDLPRKPTMETFRSLYASADYVAVSQHANIYSGITVALEAVSMGKPLLATRTGGVPTYFDDTEVLFVGVGDASEMKDKVLGQTADERREMADRARARFLEEDYSTRGMVARYIRLSNEFAAPMASPPIGLTKERTRND